MTLSLYIARRFLGSVGRVFLAFLAILLLIDMIEELRRFSDADIGLAGAAHLALLSVPETMYRILPLIIVMGAIANFLALARSSELVVVRAAGRSGPQEHRLPGYDVYRRCEKTSVQQQRQPFGVRRVDDVEMQR